MTTRRWLPWCAALALAGALGAGALALGELTAKSAPVGEGQLGVRTVVRQFERSQALLSTNDRHVAVSLHELGFDLVLPGTQTSTTPARPYWRYNEVRARRALEQLAPLFYEAPRDAEFAPRHHTRQAARAGRALNIEASLTTLASKTPEDDMIVRLSELTLAPQRSDALFPPVEVSQVLASYETDFSHKRGPRIHNIRRAAAYLDGSVLSPGEVLSFNHTVGRRTHQRGFIDAPVIINDEMESGVGGGVCQVATTLHAAAVLGGLKIVERRSHSRPSGYAPLGLDATVIDGKVDLRVKNSLQEALYVRAFLPSPHVIRVELLGASPPEEASHRYAVVKKHAFTRRVVEKDELPPGTYERHQEGRPGYETLSTVSYRSGERKEIRRYRSTYYPVPEVLWVGPSTPSSLLPPLPEGAVATQAELTPVPQTPISKLP